MSFLEKLMSTMARHGSRLCVGLDPVLEALPEGVARSPAGVLAFNRAVIEATADLACAFKPNLAFYEALGSEGWRVLEQTVRHVPDGIPIIADAKRGDIGSTANAYATAIFEVLGCDACTVNPYLGLDSMAPFLARPGSFVFVLCRTSNPGAYALQDLRVEGVPLYVRVARLIAEQSQPRSYGLVVGATDPMSTAQVVAAAPDLWLLVPGLGAQGGDVAATARAMGVASASRTLWNASRAITTAGRGHDYADHARAAAHRLRDEINCIVTGS